MGAALQRWLVDGWSRRGPAALLLLPASWLYGFLIALRKHLYRRGRLKSERVPVPVMVVGNVVAGGAGKTPLVIALVQHLQSRGFRPGVVSRGYGRSGDGCREVLPQSLASEVGDEPILIHKVTGVPVFVARQRALAARALLAGHPDVGVLVCDDGLQHYGLQRDIEICVFDESGIGNGLLLPAGPLREPWPRQTDLILTSKQHASVKGFSVRRSLGSHGRRADGSKVLLRDLARSGPIGNQVLWAVAATARPEAFFAMLRGLGLPLARTIPLPDHAGFEPAEWMAARGTVVLCTEKDATKLWRHRADALAVPLVLQIEPAFWLAFDRLFDAANTAKLSSGHGNTTS